MDKYTPWSDPRAENQRMSDYIHRSLERERRQRQEFQHALNRTALEAGLLIGWAVGGKIFNQPQEDQPVGIRQDDRPFVRRHLGRGVRVIPVKGQGGWWWRPWALAWRC